MVSEPQNDPATVPLVDVPQSARDVLAARGAPPSAADSKLYRALANEPDLLDGWLELAWRLRDGNRHTTTRLRELMIYRGAQVSDCEFERIGHEIRLRGAGVADEVIAQVESWRESSAFSPEERLALQLMEEEVLAGRLSNELSDRLVEAFDAATRVELILTAGFYCMVPRTIDALRLVRDPD
jgi:alkylhydroperoxidase family enzyme